MKQIFTLFLMAICSMVAFAEEVTYDFSASVPQPWTCNVAPSGYESTGYTRGTQFNVALKSATLTLAGVKNATKVVVTCSSNIADKNTISVSVAGNNWGTETLTKENNIEKTFTGSAANGDLKIDILPVEKSVWINKVVVTCDGAEGGNTGGGEGGENQGGSDKLDPNYTYAEPTIIMPSGESGSNTPYSFVQENILVSTTVGAQAATYFGCNAGQQITFTATKPIKAVVVNGYVKQGFEAGCDHGEIAFVDASEGEVENDPVLAIFDVNSTSVTISCVKQMRCQTVEFYFEANPDVDLDFEGDDEGDEDDELTYDYEPTEVTTINTAFDEVEYDDYSDYYGCPYTDMYFMSEDYEMEIGVFAETTPVTMIPVGTYTISESGEDGTVEASPGGDDYYDYPSYLVTDFEYLEEYESWTYNSAYYLMSGTLTVAEDPAGVKVTLDAKTYYGSTVKATFVGCPTGDEDYLEGIDTVLAPSTKADGKFFENGRISIRRNGKSYGLQGHLVRK